MGERTMSLHSWLHNLQSTLAAGRGQRHHRRRGSLRAATHRPNLEVLEERLPPGDWFLGAMFGAPLAGPALVAGNSSSATSGATSAEERQVGRWEAWSGASVAWGPD